MYYCMTDEDAVTVEADVKFVTAKLMNDTGYLWVEYTQLGYDKKGKLTCGSSEIKSRITVVKFDEEWEAVNIKEAP